MRNKILNFLSFVNEAFAEDNPGIPSEYLQNLMRVGMTRYSIKMNVEGGKELFSQIGSIIARTQTLQKGHEEALETLAKQIISEAYSPRLLAYYDLDFKLGTPPISMEPGEAKKFDAEVNLDPELLKEIQRRKIGMILQQGEAKNVMRVLALYEEHLQEIMGEKNGSEYLDCLRKISDFTDLQDWDPDTPIERKKEALSLHPSGRIEMEGYDEDEDEDEDEDKEYKEQEPIAVKIYGQDLLMLIHEAVKGIYWGVIGNISINPVYDMDTNVNTGGPLEELENIQLGGQKEGMASDWREFILSIPGAQTEDSPQNMVERVTLEIFKISSTDEFLELCNLIFSAILMKKGVVSSNLKTMSSAKRKIKEIIDRITETEVEYQKELQDLEAASQYVEDEDMIPSTEYDDDDDVSGIDLPSDLLPSKSIKKEYADMSKDELEDLLAQAVEDDEFETAIEIRNILKNR
jgi:hypothetical protein